MNNEIRPALTAEEWRHWQTKRYLHVAGNERDEVTAQVGILGNDKDHAFRVFSSSGVGGVPNTHALAALCLHGQPFGFTWVDVDDEREHAADMDGLITQLEALVDEDEIQPLRQRRARALDRAARIAALLPPRPESE
jgi:hypothetical protein